MHNLNPSALITSTNIAVLDYLNSISASRLYQGLLCIVIAISVTFSVPAFTVQATPTAQEQQHAENDRRDLRLRIEKLRQEISRNQQQQTKTKHLARTTQQSLIRQQNELRDLELARDDMEKKAHDLDQNISRLSLSISSQKILLHKLVRPHLIAAEQRADNNFVAYFFNAPSLNEFARRQTYLSYFEKAQLKAIGQLETNKNLLADLRVENNALQAKLQQNHRQILFKVADLEKQNLAQQNQITQLNQALGLQQKQIQEWQLAEQKLGLVIAQIAKKIAQARAQALAKEKLAKENARKRNLAKKKTPADSTSHKMIAADKPNTETEDAPNIEIFKGLSNNSAWPVQGRISAYFGALTVAGIRSRGIFFEAPEGVDVKAIAPGRVVFSEPLKGFGPMLIIDHGRQLMSVYGNNKTLLLKLGAEVGRGDVVAKVGSGNQSLYSSANSGLYFEVRANGRAVNPLKWLDKQ